MFDITLVFDLMFLFAMLVFFVVVLGFLMVFLASLYSDAESPVNKTLSANKDRSHA